MDQQQRDTMHARIEEFFDRDAAVFGRDLQPYRGHVHRVAEITARQVNVGDEWVEPLAVAAYYHDAAIWFDHTWDYLPGSADRAARQLHADGCDDRAAVVTAMIEEHHRLRSARHPHPLVEAMRRADAADVYRVGFPKPVTRADYRALLERYPDARLHGMLARGFLLGLREHRFNPMPMIKL